MAENKKTPNPIRAPYNFVPFSNKVLCRYGSVKELPSHDRLDKNLHSGEIHLTIEAKTPLFISDGNDHFFRTPAGTCAIPGSSLRGLVRENMQILGFGLVRPEEDLQDYQILFREVATSKHSNKGKLKDYYDAALDIKSEKSSGGKPVTIPQAVKGGYLHCKDGQYYIRPVCGEVLRLSRKHPDFYALGVDYAQHKEVCYQNSNSKVISIALPGTSQAHAGMKKGMLMSIGKPVGKNGVSPCYIFPEEDSQAEVLQLSDWEILSYREDFKMRQNSLKAYYDPEFWALPKEGSCVPVFYAQHNGKTYFGKSRFLRISYAHAISEGLPQKHLEYAKENPVFLDYPHAVLGFASKERSYRSRVSFGDLELCGETVSAKEVSPPLMEPKPSFCAGYLLDGKDYTDDDFKLRGYKQYWLKEPFIDLEGKANVNSILRPLESGSRFSGVVRFRNLTDDELGLLLWSIQLDDGCFQNIGKGKPYGYGRIAVSIDRLVEYDFASRYTYDGLTGKPQQTAAEKISGYIEAYNRYAVGQLPGNKKSVRDFPEIRDFFYMKQDIMDSIAKEWCSYLPLKQGNINPYQNNSTILKTVKQLHDCLQECQQEQTPKTDEQNLDALLAMYGSKKKNSDRKGRNRR